MYIVLLIIHLILFLISLGYIGLVLAEKASDTSKYLFAASISVFMVIMGYVLELMGSNDQFSLVSVKLQLLGLFYLNTFLLFFVARCCNFYIPLSFRIVLLMIDTVFLLFGMTAEFHPFFFTDIGYVHGDYYRRILVWEGIVCHIAQIYNLFIIAGFIFICVLDYFKNKKRKTVETLLLPLSYLLAGISTVIFYTANDRLGFNMVPGSVVLGMGFLLFMVYIFRILDTRQTAKESIAETINEGYFVVDVGKNLLFANQKAYEIFPGLYNSKERGGIIDEVYRKNRDYMEVGSKQYQVSVSPFYDRKTLKGYSLWLFDKTEEIENTKRLIELKDKAEEANRAKTIFLATMSHEIRTPMNAIMGSTEMILHSNPKPEIEEQAEAINRAGDMLLQIISGILDFSKIESGELESVEFNYDTVSYIRDTIGMFQNRITDKGLEFGIDVSPALPKGLRGDAVHLRQVITNLLDNACKYTKEGFVAIKIDAEEADNNRVKIICEVSDSGCGIKEKAIPLLFDSFKRVDIRQNIGIEGTGLGLAIARRLVEGLGGEITVQSVYGEGSTFSFYAYQTITDPAPIGEFNLNRDESRTVVKHKSIVAPDARILCVDDNETNRKVIKDLLSLFQVRADTAGSGAECLEILERDSDYDLIFMDHMMPDMDGIETAGRIMALPGKASEIPIVALTADAVAGSEERFMKNGFKGYLSKPVDLKSILKILMKNLPPEMIREVEIKSEAENFRTVRKIVFPDVETEAGLARYGNDVSKYLKVLYYIYEDGEKMIQRLKDFAADGKYYEFSCEVHAVKGIMQGIGAVKLADMARDLETDAKSANPFIDEDKLKVFVGNYEILMASIGFALRDYKLLDNFGMASSDEPAEGKEELTQEEFHKAVVEINAALEMLDASGAVKLLKELLSHPMEEDKKRILKSAHEYVADFEYEKAKEIMHFFCEEDKKG